MPLVIFQLKMRMEKKTSMSIPKRIAIEQIIPLADTGTGFWNTMVNRNHGRGRLEGKGKVCK